MRFFRIIRQTLLNDNKIRRYLVYAVGEIILVVIGILIALAINNVNQKHKIHKKEQVYLQGLRKEFQTSRIKLVELIKVNRSNLNGAKQIITFIGADSIPSEKELSTFLFSTLAFDIAFNPNNSLLNEMINSGSLKDISSDLLRIHLTTWISTVEDISKQEYDQELQRERVMSVLSGDKYSIRTAYELNGAINNQLGLPRMKKHTSNMGLLSSNEFENKLFLFISSAYATNVNHYQPLLEELDTIIELIDSELDN
ncbi:DUF6090 family protein [Carboxylicivirga linearis]|uniref:Uncharacterized protein n=1 Tax=Carboxylicivirga linearis TaxID=1628157 RepID=A0ABS5JWY2_9BACT|nr:DUF6090 family protein [Carboxylicivirga linearis]MBS2099290.1 hypothetical protein [Carboxylicivirga linearis]